MLFLNTWLLCTYIIESKCIFTENSSNKKTIDFFMIFQNPQRFLRWMKRTIYVNTCYLSSKQLFTENSMLEKNFPSSVLFVYYHWQYQIIFLLYSCNLYLGWLKYRFIMGKVVRYPKVLLVFEPGNPWIHYRTDSQYALQNSSFNTKHLFPTKCLAIKLN